MTRREIDAFTHGLIVGLVLAFGVAATALLESPWFYLSAGGTACLILALVGFLAASSSSA